MQNIQTCNDWQCLTVCKIYRQSNKIVLSLRTHSIEIVTVMHVQVNNYVSHTHRRDLYRNINYRYLAYFHCLKSKATERPVKICNRFLVWDFKPSGITDKLFIFFHFNDLV